MTVAVTSHNSENKHIPYTLKNTLFNSITFPIMNAMTKPGIKTFEFLNGTNITSAWIIYSIANKEAIDKAIDEDKFSDLNIKAFEVTNRKGQTRMHLHTTHIHSDMHSPLTLALIRRIKSFILKAQADALAEESQILLQHVSNPVTGTFDHPEPTFLIHEDFNWGSLES